MPLPVFPPPASRLRMLCCKTDDLIRVRFDKQHPRTRSEGIIQVGSTAEKLKVNSLIGWFFKFNTAQNIHQV